MAERIYKHDSDNIKNKEFTKRKLVIAVGEILKSEGYTGLG